MKAPRRWYRRPIPLMGLGGLLTLTGGLGWITDHSVDRIVVPRHYGAEPWMQEILRQPELSGLQLKKFEVSTRDGLILQAMVAQPGAAAGTTAKGKPVTAALVQAGLIKEQAGMPGARGTLVLLHGFNARKEHMLPFAERFCAAGFRCVMFDSRGHGDSGGTYATFGSRESDDLRRVIEGARQLAGPDGLGPLGLMGYSMGGAVALQAQPTLPEVKALATVSTFADFRGVISRQAGERYARLAGPLLPLVRSGTQWRAGFDPWAIRPVEAASQLTCPLFLAHGSEDGLIPVSHVHQLATAAGPRVRQLMVIPGGTHGRVFITGGDGLWGAMAVFFARELGSAAPG